MAWNNLYNNRGGYGVSRYQGSNRNNINLNRRRENKGQKENSGKFQNNSVENKKAVLKYKEAAMSKEPVKSKFCIYR